MNTPESAYFDGREGPWDLEADAPVQVLVVAESEATFKAQVARWHAKGYTPLGEVVHVAGTPGKRARNRVRESWSLTLYLPEE